MQDQGHDASVCYFGQILNWLWRYSLIISALSIRYAFSLLSGAVLIVVIQKKISIKYFRSNKLMSLASLNQINDLFANHLYGS